MRSGNLQVALDEADVIAAFRLHGRRSWESWLSYAVMSLLALALGTWILASAQFHGVMNILGALAIGSTGAWWLFIIVSALRLPARLRRNIRSRGATPGSYELAWNEEQFNFESPDSRSRKNWNELVTWRQNKRVFLVYFTPRLFWIVPKRLFADERDRDAFKALLRDKLGPENRPRPAA